MRKVTRAALALAGTAALIGVTTVPSFAADSSVTVTVVGEGIAITAPASVPLTKTGADNSTLASTATATLGATKVTDKRAQNSVGWTATVSLPDLSDGSAAPGPKLIDTATATYLAATATTVGESTLTDPATAGAVSTLDTTTPTSQIATVVNGNNSASWVATLTVQIPPATLAADYTGTLTQSLS